MFTNLVLLLENNFRFDSSYWFYNIPSKVIFDQLCLNSIQRRAGQVCEIFEFSVTQKYHPELQQSRRLDYTWLPLWEEDKDFLVTESFAMTTKVTLRYSQAVWHCQTSPPKSEPFHSLSSVCHSLVVTLFTLTQ